MLTAVTLVLLVRRRRHPAFVLAIGAAAGVLGWVRGDRVIRSENAAAQRPATLAGKTRTMLRSLISRLRQARRPLTALQVEVTTRCTRRCAVCPASALAASWRHDDLTAAAWEAIRPALPRFGHVHLQGWGEPLLHPELPRMAAEAHEAGCRAGLTTNGDLLEAAEWVTGGSIDLISVSLGGNAAGHPYRRNGSSLAKVLAATAALSRRPGPPRVSASFLLTRENATELADAVREVAAADLYELYVIHLDALPTADLANAAAFADDALRPGVATALATAADVAASCHLRLRLPAGEPRDQVACDLDPTRVVTVSADGRVGACIYQLLPIPGPVPRWTRSGRIDVEPALYGRLPEQALDVIIDGLDRANFVATFQRRYDAEIAFREALPIDASAQALAELDRAAAVRERAFASSPFPPACRGCAKARGW